jgi:hypothetical protein
MVGIFFTYLGLVLPPELKNSEIAEKLVTLQSNALIQSCGSTTKNKEAKSYYASIKHQPEQD